MVKLSSVEVLTKDSIRIRVKASIVVPGVGIERVWRFFIPFVFTISLILRCAGFAEWAV
jgi:hypothetical protein